MKRHGVEEKKKRWSLGSLEVDNWRGSEAPVDRKWNQLIRPRVQSLGFVAKGFVEEENVMGKWKITLVSTAHKISQQYKILQDKSGMLSKKV